MAKLPQLGYEYNERKVTDVFSGYDHRLKIDEGAFYETKNLTAACYPLMASRPARGRVRTFSDPGGLLAKEKLAWVDGGRLYYDGEATPVTGLSSGQKQLVGMGAYILIFPDKVYYNTADSADFGGMEAFYTSTGAVQYRLCRADGSEYDRAPVPAAAEPADPENGQLWIDTAQSRHVLKSWSAVQVEWVEIPEVYTKIIFLSEGELPGLFRRCDGVTISGAAADVNGEKILCQVGGGAGVRDYVVVTGLLDEAVEQTEGFVRLARTVPEMDFVIEAHNRLWGCRYGVSEGKTLNEIYCCALGDFKNWRQYMGISTDSWTASVGSDGPWTGAVNYLGYPMFFKENRIHRVSISSTGAHQVTETVCRGVQEGSGKSLQVVNEVLLYKSRSDVCVYQGGFPQSISAAFGDMLYSDAVAGSVGDRYYISMKDADGAYHLFVYDIKRGLWLHEDELQVQSFARVGDELYAVADGALWAMLGSEGTLEPFVSWEAETGLMYYQYPDRKYVSRYNLRLYMQEGAEIDVYMMYDSSGEWVRQGRIRMKGTRTVTLPIRPRRCDHLRMKLVGKGEVRLYSIARILTIGSDVG